MAIRHPGCEQSMLSLSRDRSHLHPHIRTRYRGVPGLIVRRFCAASHYLQREKRHIFPSTPIRPAVLAPKRGLETQGPTQLRPQPRESRRSATTPGLARPQRCHVLPLIPSGQHSVKLFRNPPTLSWLLAPPPSRARSSGGQMVSW